MNKINKHLLEIRSKEKASPRRLHFTRKLEDEEESSKTRTRQGHSRKKEGHVPMSCGQRIWANGRRLRETNKPEAQRIKRSVVRGKAGETGHIL